MRKPRDKDPHHDYDVCLLGATFATNNLGVNALTDGAISCILHHNPHARICLLDYAREPVTYTYRWRGGKTEIPVIPVRFSKSLFLENNIATLILKALLGRISNLTRREKSKRNDNFVLARLQKSRIAAAVSGGDSFSDIYGIRRFLYVAMPQILVLLTGRPLVILPQTIGPFTNPFCRLAAQWILRRAAVVYARDHEGVRYCNERILRKTDGVKAEFCYDMGFVVEKERETKEYRRFVEKMRNGCEALVGVNMSGLLHIGGYNRRNMFGLKSDYTGLMIEITESLLVRDGVKVMLVPHVLGADNPESDIVACNALVARLGERRKSDVLMPPLPYDQRGVKRYIAKCDFFIGSRMHACIAALSQNVPAVGIAYSDKFAGVMGSLNLGPLVMDIRSAPPSSIIESINDAFELRGELRARLKMQMPNVKNMVLTLFKDLASADKKESARYKPAYPFP
ncbi:MAG: hypothetical protein GF344_16900 [Chitinivibrionales bacterium]|nr:hypothetical protein [Chitinivibrionales bacterium]MBD3358361.1 hypothetical protein [Chitinivibrionales bacterium]